MQDRCSGNRRAYTAKPAPHRHVGENGPRDLSTLPPGAPLLGHTLWVLSPGACRGVRVVTRAQTRASPLASVSMEATPARRSSPSCGVAVTQGPPQCCWGVLWGPQLSCESLSGARASFAELPEGVCLATRLPRTCCPAGVCSDLALRSACARVGGIFLKALDLKGEMYFITASAGAPAS